MSKRYLERGCQEKEEEDKSILYRYDELFLCARFFHFENEVYEVYDETREKESQGFFDLS